MSSLHASVSVSVTVQTLTTTEELERLASAGAADWNRLLERTGNVLPFLLPEWVTSWWGSFRQDRPLIRDSLRVKVVRKGDDVVGILPFMVTERPRVGPLRTRGVGLVGADEYVTEQRAPIVDPACQREVAEAVANDLLADREWDWVSWDGVHRDSEFARALERSLGVRWGRCEVANILPLRPSWAEFRAGLRRNIKESLRHCTNSLKRDGLSARLVVAVTPDEVAKALRTFFAMHTARSRMNLGVHHPDRFASEQARHFLEEVCRRLASPGRRVARVFTLEVDGKPVATRVGFVLPEGLYLYYSGFDPSFGKYSIMTTALAEIIKYAIDLRLPRVHLSMGLDVSKSRWGGAAPMVHQGVCVRPTWTSETAHRLYMWGRHSPGLRHAIGRLLPKRRFD
jgi:CelD/BcsL family acetyltransferase involved in cellulose biosynthesis